MYNLDGVALSGSLLASLLNEAASPYAGSEPRQVRQVLYCYCLFEMHRRFCPFFCATKCAELYNSQGDDMEPE